MRKLKLQMQITTDGFACGPNGELNWMTWQWDQPLKDFAEKLLETVDTIVMGRKMSHSFTAHWESVVNNPAADKSQQDYKSAEVFVNLPKHIFSKTLASHEGKNTIMVSGNLAEEVNKLKAQKGQDIIVYGGASFVRSLVEARLIDELYLFINPTAIGEGLRIFSGKTPMKLVASMPFECGIVVNQYRFA